MAYRLSTAKETAIYTWVSTILSGLTIIWDKPNQPRPALPYATLNISSGPRSDGSPQMRYKSTNTYTYTIRKIFTLTVNIYAENTYLSYVESLINSIHLSTTQTTLRLQGMAIWNNSDPIDVSQLLDTKFEQRVSVDFTLAYASTVDDAPNEIIKITFDGNDPFEEQTIEAS